MGHLPGTEWLDAKGSLSVPEEFPADFPPHPAGTPDFRFAAFRSTSPLIFSVLVHLAVFSVLAWSLHPPDRRPVKEVNYWVVSLVAAWKEDPAQREPSSPGANAPSRGPVPARWKQQTDPPIQKRVPGPEAAAFQEFPGPTEAVPERSAAALEPLSRPLEPEKAASPVQNIQAYAANQFRTGQALLRMRMGHELAGARMKYFYKNLREQVIVLIRNSPATDFTQAFTGGGTSLDITYREDGEVEKISASPGFEETAADLFGGPEWKKLPSPVKFGLPFKAVRLRISVDPAGQVNVGIAPL